MGPFEFDPSLLLADISGNSLILLGVLVAMIFAIAYALYTRQGSGINTHPVKDSSDPVLGDETKNDGEDEETEDERAGIDLTESHEMDQRGTK